MAALQNMLTARATNPAGEAPASRAPQMMSAPPSSASGIPHGERRRALSQNWVSTGLSSTKSRVPSRTCSTRRLRLGCKKDCEIPESTVKAPSTTTADGQDQPPRVVPCSKNRRTVNTLAPRLSALLSTEKAKLERYSSSAPSEVEKNSRSSAKCFQ